MPQTTQTKTDTAPRLIDWLTLVLLSLIWGSSFILIKKSLIAYSFDQVGALRVITAYLFLLPVAILSLRKVPKGKWGYIVAMGLLGNFIPAFLFAKAQTQIPSSVTGVLNALTPLFTLIAGVLFFKVGIKRTQLIGLIIGFGGCVILSLVGSDGGFGQVNYYFSFIILATICYGINANIIKVHLTTIPALRLTALAMFGIGPLAIIYLLTTDFTYRLANTEGAWLALGYLTILGVLGTAIALAIFNKMIQYTSAVFATSVTYIIPIVAIAWGVFDGEVLETYHYVGMVAIIIGVFITNRSK
ncbi:DMT family transporter [Flammeovirgaceae bacterium SG7u.111]|nr:DMT family transporter [Flammeovirgaceae bacterium SG7u.132]WPO35481.1 DMT family transporter [Flammeovirgaceae bacterium SG7u.111]